MTDAVVDEIKVWQARPLEAVYPIVYLDALFVSIRDGGTVTKKAIYVALGMTLDGGGREVLGFWIEATESARFWLHVLTELKNRGLEDILFICCDGLTGLPQAVETAFPKTIVQTCIVHMIRNSLRYVSWDDRKAIVDALRTVYGADTEDAARLALNAFDDRWGAKYPAIAKQWRVRWPEVVPFLSYPREVRRILYTTNIIESLNAQLRKVLRPKGAFPTDEAVMKIFVPLAAPRGKRGGKLPSSGKQSLAHFSIVFGDRFPA